MKIILMIGHVSHHPNLQAQLGKAFGVADVEIVSGPDFITADEIALPDEIAEAKKRLLEIEYLAQPKVEQPFMVEQVSKPFHRTTNKYQNKRRNRRH